MASGNIKKDLAVITETLSSVTIAALNSGQTSKTVNLPSGFNKILGVVGYETGNTVLTINSLSINNNSVFMSLYNTYSGSSASATPTVTLLISS